MKDVVNNIKKLFRHLFSGDKIVKYRDLRKTAIKVLLWLYRYCVSPWKPACCRFSPSCSQYAATAVIRFGFIKGSWLGMRRLLRCHPLNNGPVYDPVPLKKSRSGEIQFKFKDMHS